MTTRDAYRLRRLKRNAKPRNNMADPNGFINKRKCWRVPSTPNLNCVIWEMYVLIHNIQTANKYSPENLLKRPVSLLYKFFNFFTPTFS